MCDTISNYYNDIENLKPKDLPKNYGRLKDLPDSKRKPCDIKTLLRSIQEKRGVHSKIAIEAAGFRYTNNGDTA